MNRPLPLIAYGLDSGQEGIIAVYDLGGGTFDISILRLSKGIFEVLATGGDSALGGDDFDHLLGGYLIEQAGVTQNLSAEEMRKVLNLPPETKITLSTQDTAEVNVLGWQSSVTRKLLKP